MKKKLITMILISSMAVGAFVGCGKNSDSSTSGTTEAASENGTSTYNFNSMEYIQDLDCLNYVDPVNYTGLDLTSNYEKTEITDADVKDQIDSFMANASTTETVTDRTDVQDGDTVTIDYAGSMNGKLMDNASDTDYDLVIGSGTFIDGFEDQLIGMKVGDTNTITVTFPDDYGDADLAGKDAKFTVTIKAIKHSVPATLNDDYVKSLGIADVDTVDKFRTYVKNYLTYQNTTNYETPLFNEMIKDILDNNTFKMDPPQSMVDRYKDLVKEDYQSEADTYGIDVDTVIKYYNGLNDNDSVDDFLNKQGIEVAKQYIVANAIAEKEGWTYSDDDYQKDIEEQAAAFGYDSVESAISAAVDDERQEKEYMQTRYFLRKLLDMQNITYESSEDTASGASSADDTEASTEASTEATTEASTEATTEANMSKAE